MDSIIPNNTDRHQMIILLCFGFHENITTYLVLEHYFKSFHYQLDNKTLLILLLIFPNFQKHDEINISSLT